MRDVEDGAAPQGPSPWEVLQVADPFASPGLGLAEGQGPFGDGRASVRDLLRAHKCKLGAAVVGARLVDFPPNHAQPLVSLSAIYAVLWMGQAHQAHLRSTQGQ